MALKGIDSCYRQRQFVEAGGWAVMPSKDEAPRQAADLCAKVLIDLHLTHRPRRRADRSPT